MHERFLLHRRNAFGQLAHEVLEYWLALGHRKERRRYSVLNRFLILDEKKNGKHDHVQITVFIMTTIITTVSRLQRSSQVSSRSDPTAQFDRPIKDIT